MAVRHLVMWTLKDKADAPRFKAELDSCAALVPGMLHFRAAIAEPGFEANVDVLLDSTFADAAALDAYQNHPHHQTVAKILGTLRQTRHVLDYTTEG
ncbi:MAG: Dabb family protein [Rubrivivax sp.]